jgi:rSAM/selenodomain-associated transferase 1
MKDFPTRRPPARRLLIFARVPELGQVKTRLARELGDEKTLAVYRAMVADLLQSIGPPDDSFEIEILWTGSAEVDGATLAGHFDHFPLAKQTGANLGDRLAVAFSERMFFHQTEEVIAIGADDPALSRRTIETAFRLLDSCEWVIGPAVDGGYYLIGCRAASFNSLVFQDIAWSSPTVFAETSRRIRTLGSTLASMPQRRDIDEVDDLRAYASLAPPDGQVAGLLRAWGWLQ